MFYSYFSSLKTPLILSLLLAISACGGGGSGGDSEPTIRVSDSNIDFQAYLGDSAPEPRTFRVSVSNRAGFPGELFFASVHSGNGIDRISSDLDSNVVPVTVYPRFPGSVGIGTHFGRVGVAICKDIDCNSHIKDSPFTVNVVYTVSPAPDADKDGVPDRRDPFPNDPNETLDTDNDGIGNNADTDDDGDGVEDVVDLFPLDPLESIDTDGDGIGNNADYDDDNDSFTDQDDDFPLDPLENTDTDKDGVGDNSDDDIDNDSVANDLDSFPFDIAASEDEDGDGYPKEWNAGFSVIDSTTGLVLDQFPQDRACWLSSHANAQGDCDFGATIPQTAPTITLADKSGGLYLLFEEQAVIYRWSVEDKTYLKPIYLGFPEQRESFGRPKILMTYSESHDRLYIQYLSGEITYIDLMGESVEVEFSNRFKGKTGELIAFLSVGDYLLVRSDIYGGFNDNWVFDVNGNASTVKGLRDLSTDYIWNQFNNSVYFIGSEEVQYIEIDQITSEIVGEESSSISRALEVESPLVLSSNGERVLVGSGEIFNATDLSWIRTIPDWQKSLWLDNGDLIVARSLPGQFELMRYNKDFEVEERRLYEGSVVALLKAQDDTVIISQENGNLAYELYISSDDTDGDGVDNRGDDFPLEVAASIDSDNDGFPDRWNDGFSTEDSTSGLQLDAFPNDSSCWLAEHDDGTGECNVSGTIPKFTPDILVSNGKDEIYLLSKTHNRIYRWSSSTKSYKNEIVLGRRLGSSAPPPILMSYSNSHNRLYLGYENGEITYIDLGTAGKLNEVLFTSVSEPLKSVISPGELVIAQRMNSLDRFRHIYNKDGQHIKRGSSPNYMQSSAWDPVNNRVFFASGSDGDSIGYEKIDQATNDITASDTSYRYRHREKTEGIIVSLDGNIIAVKSGEIFDAQELSYQSAINPFNHGLWLTDNELLVSRSRGDEFELRRYGQDLNALETRVYPGQNIGLVRDANGNVIIRLEGGSLFFDTYLPNNDTDNDGVENNKDAFPTDKSASIDSDNDGYPDKWNDGYSSIDSSTGLEIDFFPNDSACWLASQGNVSGLCNYTNIVSGFTPNSLAVDSKGNVYVLHSSVGRVYQWSSSPQSYIASFDVSYKSGLNKLNPRLMTFSEEHNRLYFSYSSGAITYIDLGGSLKQKHFASTLYQIGSLTSYGNFILAYDYDSGGNVLYVFDKEGSMTDRQGVFESRLPNAYGLNKAKNRFYALHQFVNQTLTYIEIDQNSGEIINEATEYLAGVKEAGVDILFNKEGDRVILGSGHIYDAEDFRLIKQIPGFHSGVALPDGGYLVLNSKGGEFELIHYKSDFTVLQKAVYNGNRSGLFVGDDNYLLARMESGTLYFDIYQPNPDVDGDGIDNYLDDFPLDVAASIDSDNDGFPDDWNSGFGESDSTTNLSVDLFPNDEECWLSSHATTSGECDYGLTMPLFNPDAVISDGNDGVYLLSKENNKLFHWSISKRAYKKPITIGRDFYSYTIAPSLITFSTSQKRFYFAYDTGEITYLSLGSLEEKVFHHDFSSVSSFASVGNYLLVQGVTDYGEGRFTFDENGILSGTSEEFFDSFAFAWSPINNRVYFFVGFSSKRPFHGVWFENINQNNGSISNRTLITKSSPSGREKFPILVSSNGDYVSLGSGYVFNAVDSSWSIPIPSFDSGLWLSNGELLTLTQREKEFILIRYDQNFGEIENRVYPGEQMSIINSAEGIVLISKVGTEVQFESITF